MSVIAKLGDMKRAQAFTVSYPYIGDGDIITLTHPNRIALINKKTRKGMLSRRTIWKASIADLLYDAETIHVTTRFVRECVSEQQKLKRLNKLVHASGD